jgi:nucleosome binding factor SPN SPT16 subunit
VIQKAMETSNTNKSVGVLKKEIHIGNFAETMMTAVEGGKLGPTTNVASLISEVLLLKDTTELSLIKQSARLLAVGLMKSSFVREVEKVIEDELQVSHREICNKIENVLSETAVLEKWKKRSDDDDDDFLGLVFLRMKF